MRGFVQKLMEFCKIKVGTLEKYIRKEEGVGNKVHVRTRGKEGSKYQKYLRSMWNDSQRGRGRGSTTVLAVKGHFSLFFKAHQENHSNMFKFSRESFLSRIWNNLKLSWKSQAISSFPSLVFVKYLIIQDFVNRIIETNNF